MAIELIRQEIYDHTGLKEVVYIEQEVPDVETLISEKESELIKIYDEIQKLKNQ